MESFFLLFLVLGTICPSGSVNRWVFMNCSASNLTVSSNFSCFIKTHSYWNTTMNGGGFIRKPVYDVSVKFELGFSSNVKGPYKRILKYSQDKLCSLLEKIEEFQLLQWIVQKLGPEVRKYVHKCPYEVSFQTITKTSLVLKATSTSLPENFKNWKYTERRWTIAKSTVGILSWSIQFVQWWWRQHFHFELHPRNAKTVATEDQSEKEATLRHWRCCVERWTFVKHHQIAFTLKIEDSNP